MKVVHQTLEVHQTALILWAFQRPKTTHQAAQESGEKVPQATSGFLEQLQRLPLLGNVRELENILERALAFANDGVIEVADLALRGSKSWSESGGRRASDSDEIVPTYAPATETTVAAQPTEIPAELDAADLSHAPALASSLDAPALSDPSALETPAPVANQAKGVYYSASCELPNNLPEFLDSIERDIIQRALEKTHNNRTNAAELLGISFRQLRYQIQRLNISEAE